MTDFSRRVAKALRARSTKGQWVIRREPGGGYSLIFPDGYLSLMLWRSPKDVLWGINLGGYPRATRVYLVE